MRRLAYTLHFEDPETGRTVVLLKGSTPSERVQGLITNPDVWEEIEEPAETPEPAPVEAPAAVQADDAEPPRSGKGSSKDAWAAFAAKHGVPVADDDTRDDIIHALAAAGVVNE